MRLRRNTRLKRNWQEADTCSSSVELTFSTVTPLVARMVAVRLAPGTYLAFLDDLLALDVVLPAARAQHFPDFRVRELVEELQSSQDSELLLLVDARVRFAQSLVNPGQLRGQVQAALVALLRIFLQRHCDDILQLLRNVAAQGVNRRRRRVYDLMQQ